MFRTEEILFNFMHGICFDYELQDWFEFKIPKTKIHLVLYSALEEDPDFNKAGKLFGWEGSPL
jgi:hypothetical protein